MGNLEQQFISVASKPPIRIALISVCAKQRQFSRPIVVERRWEQTMVAVNLVETGSRRAPHRIGCAMPELDDPIKVASTTLHRWFCCQQKLI
jgi:hypothetical protein